MKHIEKLHEKFPILLVIVICFFNASMVKSQTALTKALDYNGDGKADFSVFRPTNNTWYVDKRIGSVFTLQHGSSELDTPTPGDYDGDGKGDIAFWRESNGIFYYVESSTNSFIGIQFGSIGDEPVARDYDGDGKTDCAVVRRENGALLWYILQSSNNSLTGYQYGISSDYPAPGDYDGDRRFDIAVQRKVSGNLIFYRFLSSTLTTNAVQFGLEYDLFVPGDYDGDGKTDIALVRGGQYKDFPDNIPYTWNILRSSNGSSYSVNYGRYDLRDFPVQADYDGDGKTDIAVWRNTEGDYYVNKSSGGEFGYHSGLRGDLPVASYDTH